MENEYVKLTALSILSVGDQVRHRANLGYEWGEWMEILRVGSMPLPFDYRLVEYRRPMRPIDDCAMDEAEWVETEQWLDDIDAMDVTKEPVQISAVDHKDFVEQAQQNMVETSEELGLYEQATCDECGKKASDGFALYCVECASDKPKQQEWLPFDDGMGDYDIVWCLFDDDSVELCDVDVDYADDETYTVSSIWRPGFTWTTKTPIKYMGINTPESPKATQAEREAEERQCLIDMLGAYFEQDGFCVSPAVTDLFIDWHLSQGKE